jgi:gliding motility-associated-like protein
MPIDSEGLYQLVTIFSDYCPGEALGQMQVDYFALPSGQIEGPAEICFGDTANLMLSLSGNGPYNFDFLKDGQYLNSYTDIESEVVFETLSGGEFQMVQITDVNCHQTDTISFLLGVKPLPEVNAGPDVNFCSGDTVWVGTAAISGQTYQWNDADGLLETDTALAPFTWISNVSSGESQNLIISTNLNGCSQSDTVVVTVYGEPLAGIEGNNQICSGDSVLLVGTGGDANWSPANLFTDPNNPTTYFVGTTDEVVQLTVTSPYGCKSTMDYEIQVLPVPYTDISISQTVGCVPFSVNVQTLFPVPGESYRWRQNGNLVGEEQSIQLMYNAPGTYEISLAITGSNGCRVYDTIDTPIQVSETYADFEFDDFDLRASNAHVEFNNLSPFNVQSHWTIDTLAEVNIRNLEFTFPTNIGATYEVCLNVIDPLGCTAQFCDSVFIKDDFQVYVPNSFTPNGDGINDTFYPQLLYSDVQLYHFWIIDSKGQIVFDSYDANQKWDGYDTYGQSMGENDIFIWNLEVKPDPVAELRSYSGHVLLLR